MAVAKSWKGKAESSGAVGRFSDCPNTSLLLEGNCFSPTQKTSWGVGAAVFGCLIKARMSKREAEGQCKELWTVSYGPGEHGAGMIWFCDSDRPCNHLGLTFLICKLDITPQGLSARKAGAEPGHKPLIHENQRAEVKGSLKSSQGHRKVG